MQKYELVLMLDASLSEKDRKSLLSTFETEIKDCILQKDEIGLKQTVYDFNNVKGHNNFYIYSYYIQAENKDLDLIKKLLLYNKAIARYFIFKMKNTQEFFMFDELQNKLSKMLQEMEEKKVGQKINFFANKENKKYLTRKALPILKKYMTRFGDIKPRKYTKNSVLIQKKIKESITRAREIGLLEYLK